MDLLVPLHPTRSLSEKERKTFWAAQDAAEFKPLMWAMFMSVFCFLLPGVRQMLPDVTEAVRYEATLVRLVCCTTMLIMAWGFRTSGTKIQRYFSFHTYLMCMNVTQVVLMVIDPVHAFDVTPIFIAQLITYGGLIKRPGHLLSACACTLVASVVGILAIHAALGPALAVAMNEFVVMGLTLYVYLAMTHSSVKAFKSELALQRQAERDSLTGVLNRGRWEAELQAWDRTAEREGCLLFLDIDHFKRINDTLGHEEGDRVLTQMAAIVTSEIRDGDFFARLGGEEFGLLLEDPRVEIALALAQRLRQAVEKADFSLDHSVTVSIGVAQRNPHENADAWQRRADHAMYRAKKSGRNRVMLARSTESMGVADGRHQVA